MNQPSEKRDGLLLVVSGPAGVGKGTIDGALLSRHSNILLSVSATTRKPRPGEIDGVHYHFVDEEAFKRMIQEDAFLEYMHVFETNYYGTPRRFVFDQLALGNDVILEIDVQGAMRVKKACPDAVLIFIAPPDMDTLKSRLVGRATETPEAIEKRFTTAFAEMKYMKEYDYVVLNDDLETAISRMEHIVEAEKCKVCRNAYMIQRLMGGVD